MAAEIFRSRYADQPLNIARECVARHAHSELAKKTAMVFVAADLSYREVSYAELEELTARFAASLRARGLTAGDRLLLRLPNTYAFPVAFFGALRAGMIPVPSSPMLTGPEVSYLLKDSGARAMVTEASLLQSIRHECDLSALAAMYVDGSTEPGELSFSAELGAQSPEYEISDTRGASPAYIVYTSGTTGYPKGVLHAQQALFGRLPAATQWFPFSEPGFDRILHSGKFNWTYVLGTGMMDPLYHGKTVIVYEGENSAQRWIDLIGKFGCNIFIGVPTIFRQILQKTQAGSAQVPMLRHAMCAGEHLSDEVLSLWTQRFGFPVYEGLGMSECSYYISQRRGEPAKPNSAGKIQQGHIVELLDENLQPVPAGEEGMLCIRRDDPGLFIEYWNADEANAQQFSGNWFLTGDYAIIDADGYVFFMGRRDDIIKSFGYRVSPFEVERIYRDHPAIEDVAAFGEQVENEKTLISLCVLMKAGQSFDETALLEWGAARLASYKRPKKIHLLQKFPRSANGKVLRNQLTRAIAENENRKIS